MDKIMVEVYIPSLNTSMDMLIPSHLLLNDVLEMIKKAVCDASDGRFIPDVATSLCRKDGTILNINLYVSELNIRNGSKLLLV